MSQGSDTVSLRHRIADRTSPIDLTSVGKRMPLSLVKPAGSAYVAAAKALDRNRFVYEYDGHEFHYEYTDFYSFAYLYNCIRDGSMRHEGISLEVLELAPSFDAIVDVGAHFGVYAVALGVLNPETPVYAVEPNARNAAVLQANLAANGIDGTVIERAVSDGTGAIEFFEHPSAHNAHTTARPADAREFSTTRTESIALSQLFAEESIDDAFLKIDAEGEEGKIVDDLLSNAGNGRLSGILEVHPERMHTPVGDLFESLDAHGFEYAVIKEKATSPGYYFSNFESVDEVLGRGADVQNR